MHLLRPNLDFWKTILLHRYVTVKFCHLLQKFTVIEFFVAFTVRHSITVFDSKDKKFNSKEQHKKENSFTYWVRVFYPCFLFFFLQF